MYILNNTNLFLVQLGNLLINVEQGVNGFLLLAKIQIKCIIYKGFIAGCLHTCKYVCPVHVPNWHG